jgi:hypothetical protein
MATPKNPVVLMLSLTESEQRELLEAVVERRCNIAPELAAGEPGYKTKAKRLDRLERMLRRPDFTIEAV